MIRRLILSEDFALFEEMKNMILGAETQDLGRYDVAEESALVMARTLPSMSRLRHDVEYLASTLQTSFNDMLSKEKREKARDEAFRVLSQYRTYL